MADGLDLDATLYRNEVDRLVAAVRDRDRQIERVRALHKTHFQSPDGVRYGCQECHTINGPCPTLRALDGER